jgi:hypothetical protein
MGFALLNDADASDDTAESVAFRHRPVDLAHLARHTKGNTIAERELLGVFRRQIHAHFDKLHLAQDINAWSDAAKAMEASARGVGAWQIVNSAENAERIAGATQYVRQELLTSLKQQIDEANTFITAILEHA